MKWFFVLSTLICALAAVGAPHYSLHPFVQTELANYPPLGSGGYRIVRLDGGRHAVLGVGRAKLAPGFFRAAAAAELDAELQIAKALNAVATEVETSQETTKNAAPDGSHSVVRSTARRIVLDLAASTPFVSSCGMWQNGGSLYCARVLWCGPPESVATGPGGAPWTELPENLPYLRSGGTVMLHRNGEPYLVTVVRVPDDLPLRQSRDFARMQAHKNLLAFVTGGNLRNRIVALNETVLSPEESSRRVRRRKYLERTVRGGCRFIEPSAQWHIPETGCRFFLFAVELTAAPTDRD